MKKSNSNKRKIILIVSIVLVVILYLIPATKKDFFKLYQTDDTISNSLKEFYKKVELKRLILVKLQNFLSVLEEE